MATYVMSLDTADEARFSGIGVRARKNTFLSVKREAHTSILNPRASSF
jgi:hypothetical protein